MLGLAACAIAGLIPHLLSGKRIAGQVVDPETGKGVANAYVAFYWESPIAGTTFTGHSARDICYHVSVGKTNNEGLFEVSAWKKWSSYDVHPSAPSGVVYAPKYVPYYITSPSADRDSFERVNERLEVTQFSGTRDERMNMLFRGLANHDCRYGGDSQTALYPMFKAIFVEFSRLAQTRADRETLDAIARIAAKAALARDPNGAADDAEIERFIRENLR
jgi:hypothetical protein